MSSAIVSDAQSVRLENEFKAKSLHRSFTPFKRDKQYNDPTRILFAGLVIKVQLH